MTCSAPISMKGRYRHIDQVGSAEDWLRQRSSGPEDLDASERLSRLRVSLATGSTWTSERHSPTAASSEFCNWLHDEHHRH